MSGTLIPRNTLLAACIAKSAHEADVDAGKPTAAQEAIATADSYLNNAVLPTYSELLEALRAHDALSLKCDPESLFAGLETLRARALIARHDHTLAGNFKA